MSFTLSQSLTHRKIYDSIGGAAVEGSAETMDVTYTALYVESVDENNNASVKYSMSVSGSTNGYNYINFPYSGSGDILDAAETAIQASLTTE